MAAPRSHFQQFVRISHRRFVFAFVLRKVASGLMVGCAIAVMMILGLWWLGLPSFTTTLGSLIIPALIGLIIGLLYRPTATEAMLDIDRRFNLADLLSTTLLVDLTHDASVPSPQYSGGRVRVRGLSTRRTDLNDPWTNTLRQIADARCRELGVERIHFQTGSPQQWGGLVLLMTLLLTLSFFMSNVSQIMTTNEVVRTTTAVDSLGVSATELLGTRIESSFKPTQTHPQDPETDGQPDQTPGKTVADKSDPSDAIANQKSSSSDGMSGGSGAGESRNSAAPSQISNQSEAATRHEELHTGKISVGGQSADRQDNSDNGQRAANGLAGVNPSSVVVPPWKSATWQADRQQAQHQARSNKSYDPYRDVIQRYFDQQ